MNAPGVGMAEPCLDCGKDDALVFFDFADEESTGETAPIPRGVEVCVRCENCGNEGCFRRGEEAALDSWNNDYRVREAFRGGQGDLHGELLDRRERAASRGWRLLAILVTWAGGMLVNAGSQSTDMAWRVDLLLDWLPGAMLFCEVFFFSLQERVELS